ncbi:hypothetical protein CI610_02451 [invertebrate metagenome]|uniref:Uncharacterized protein n=1 Tax=invertebrate metagenome TaxID=1711999 RepID=A0A2H9T5X4_9ZZZZ
MKFVMKKITFSSILFCFFAAFKGYGTADLPENYFGKKTVNGDVSKRCVARWSTKNSVFSAVRKNDFSGLTSDVFMELIDSAEGKFPVMLVHTSCYNAQEEKIEFVHKQNFEQVAFVKGKQLCFDAFLMLSCLKTIREDVGDSADWIERFLSLLDILRDRFETSIPFFCLKTKAEDESLMDDSDLVEYNQLIPAPKEWNEPFDHYMSLKSVHSRGSPMAVVKIMNEFNKEDCLPVPAITLMIVLCLFDKSSFFKALMGRYYEKPRSSEITDIWAHYVTVYDRYRYGCMERKYFPCVFNLEVFNTPWHRFLCNRSLVSMLGLLQEAYLVGHPQYSNPYYKWDGSLRYCFGLCALMMCCVSIKPSKEDYPMTYYAYKNGWLKILNPDMLCEDSDHILESGYLQWLLSQNPIAPKSDFTLEDAIFCYPDDEQNEIWDCLENRKDDSDNKEGKSTRLMQKWTMNALQGKGFIKKAKGKSGGGGAPCAAGRHNGSGWIDRRKVGNGHSVKGKRNLVKKHVVSHNKFSFVPKFQKW